MKVPLLSGGREGGRTRKGVVVGIFELVLDVDDVEGGVAGVVWFLERLQQGREDDPAAIRDAGGGALAVDGVLPGKAARRERVVWV